MRSLLTLGLVAALLSTPASAQTTDDFELYVIGGGSAETIGVSALEDTTLTGTGQGPGLVNDGCTYNTTGTALQWNGVGWYGLGSKCINANYPDLTLSYDAPVTSVSFNLANFDGYGDTCTINLYDAGGSLVSSTAGISIPDSTPVPFTWTGSGVTDVEIINDNLQWSPMIDDHTYTNGGMALVIQGTCPGPMQLSLTGATPGGSVALAYGPLGTFTIPSGPCIGTVLDLGTPTLAGIFTADAAGALSFSFTAPAALCGLSVQGVDLTTCDT
ncbi:MAG: hypothetical protein ACPG31_13905, partial [Planctomycetota bacterium]